MIRRRNRSWAAFWERSLNECLNRLPPNEDPYPRQGGRITAPRRGASRPAPGRRHRLLRGVAGDRSLRITVAPGLADPPLNDDQDVAGRGEANEDALESELRMRA